MSEMEQAISQILKEIMKWLPFVQKFCLFNCICHEKAANGR